MTIDIDSSPKKRIPSISKSSTGEPSNYHKCFQNYYHGHQYLQPNPTYVCDTKITVNHWQLRDLVQVDEASGSLFYTKGNSIRLLDMAEGMFASHIKSHDHFDLDYTPRCFSHSGEAIVTGGVILPNGSSSVEFANLATDAAASRLKPAKGLFSFYDPESDARHSYKLGEMINNAVSLYPSSSSLHKAYVCNNDSHVYAVDIDNRDISLNTKIKCEDNTALNNVCQVPDSKLLTITGDLALIFLLDPTIKNPKIKSINTRCDSGFGISYHSNGYMFSAAFQDGLCLLYDIRNLRDDPLFEIKSTRPGHQSGAFRCCKFATSSTSDLLFISEHVGRVHLVDLRNLSYDKSQMFSDRQVMVFPSALEQFASYERPKSEEGSSKQSAASHMKVPIYDNGHFSVPLVYDYDYLTNVNPKLFSNYSFKPPQKEAKSPRTLCPSSDHYDSSDDDINSLMSHTYTRNYHHDAYQQEINHIHGELELCGVDWYNGQLLVGCEGGGVVTWDVNNQARRSSECYLYA